MFTPTLQLLLFTVFVYSFALLMIKHKKIAVIVSILVPLSLLLGEATNTWFSEFKRWAITLPVIYYAYVTYRSEYITPGSRWEHINNCIFSTMVAFNLLSLIPAELSAESVFNHFNAVFLLLLIIFIPRHWQTENKDKVYGFDNNFWMLLYTSTMLYFFITNPIVAQIQEIAIILLGLALIGRMHMGHATYWFAFRVYTLNATMLLKAHAPNLVLTTPTDYQVPISIAIIWLSLNSILAIIIAINWLTTR